jgi:cytochrome c556
MNSKRYSFYAVVAILSALSAMATAAEPDLKGIMQGLRDDVVAIADGLLIDDLKSVADGATRIANHARIPAEQVQLVAAELGSEMATFKQFDVSVHDLSLSIAAAAEKGDREGAIADYQSMMSGCLACHAAYKERVAAVLNEPGKGE